MNKVRAYLEKTVKKDIKEACKTIATADVATPEVGSRQLKNPLKPQKNDSKNRPTKICGPGTKAASKMQREHKQNRDRETKLKEEMSIKF